MTDITAGSLVRWTMCLNDPHQTVVVRGRVRTVHGRRFADVELGDAGITILLPYGDLTRIEPMPRGGEVIDMTARRRGKVVRIGGCDLGGAA